MIVLGIDIGVTGAISAVDSRGTCAVEDLPIVVGPSGKRVDARALIHMVRVMVPPGHEALACIEDVRARRMAGRVTSHSSETVLVLARGAIEAVLQIARIECRAIQPQAWKSFCGIAADKTGRQARDTAATLYPLAAHKLKRVKDHNRAEALLIAHFGMARFA